MLGERIYEIILTIIVIQERIGRGREGPHIVVVVTGDNGAEEAKEAKERRTTGRAETTMVRWRGTEAVKCWNSSQYRAQDGELPPCWAREVAGENAQGRQLTEERDVEVKERD